MILQIIIQQQNHIQSFDLMQVASLTQLVPPLLGVFQNFGFEKQSTPRLPSYSATLGVERLLSGNSTYQAD